MKKQELKVGVEYAVVMRSRAARSRYGVSPFKATLIDINFSEKRMGLAYRSYGSQAILEEKVVKGIAVDTGSKVFVKGDVPLRNEDGTFQVRSDAPYGKKYITKPEQFSYDYIVLENAGCFISTWEEWEEKQKADAELAARTKAERAQKERERKANEASIKSRVDAVLATLGRVGEVKIETSEWRRDNLPDDFYVMQPGIEERYESIIKGEFRYGDGPEGERVLVGLVVGSGQRGGGLSLSAVEALIEAARDV